jgi:hypothetical protein
MSPNFLGGDHGLRVGFREVALKDGIPGEFTQVRAGLWMAQEGLGEEVD